MIYLFWVAVLLAIALFLSVFFDKKIELTFAPAIFASIIVMYLFGVFGALYYGLFAVIGLALACGAYVVWRMIREKKLFTEKWLTPGCAILLVFVVIIAKMHANRIPSSFDEFTHWALTVKIMYVNDALTVTLPESCIFPDYPPATALFEYMFVRFTPDFTESYIYRALTLLQVSLILPITSFFNWRRFPVAAISFCSLFLIPTFFRAEAYTITGVDIALGMFFFYLIFIVITAEKRNAFLAFAFSAAGAVLVLTKKSGVIFWLVALCLVLAYAFSRFKQIPSGEKRLRQSALLTPLIYAGGGILALTSWSVVKGIYIPPQAGSFRVVNVWGNLKSLLGPWSEYQGIVAENYTNTLISESFKTSITITPLVWCVLCAAVLAYAFHKMPSNSPIHEARRRIAAVVFGGLAVYIFLLFYMFSFVFSEHEGERLSSWWRYLGSYYLALVLLSVSLLIISIYCIKEEGAKEPSLCPSLAVLCAALFLAPSLVFLFLPKTDVRWKELETAAYNQGKTFAAALESDDSVYYWEDDSMGFGCHVMKYYLYPTTFSNSAGYNFNASNPAFSSWSTDTSPAELAQALKSCDYLYIQNISEYSQEKYAELFDEAPSSEGVSVYEISDDNGELRLERLS